MPDGQMIGQKEATPDAGDYRVLMRLKKFAAKRLGVNPDEPIVFTFDSADEARKFHAIAQSKSTALTVPWNDGKKVVLQPAAWGDVALQTPQGVLVTPAPVVVQAAN